MLSSQQYAGQLLNPFEIKYQEILNIEINKNQNYKYGHKI
jgi:hypothetical protein